MIASRSPRVVRAAFPAAFASLAAVATALLATPAWAQDRATASALFDKGLAAMKAKDFSTACPALAESYKIDPLPGTLFTLAECEAGSGATASAMLHYADFLAAVQAMPVDAQRKQQPRVDRTQAQRKALEKTVAHLTLTLPKDAPPNATVKRDGMVVPSVVFGTAVAVDPGSHTVVTEAPGRQAKEQTLAIVAGKDQTVTLSFGPPVGAATPSTAAAPPPPTEPSPPPEEDAPKKPVAGYVLLGVGGAALATGAVFGVLALGKKGQVDDNCTGKICNQTGKDAGDALKTFSTVSTIGVAVGVVGVGVGGYLLVRRPSQKTSAFTVAPTFAVVGPRDGFGGVVGTF